MRGAVQFACSLVLMAACCAGCQRRGGLLQSREPIFGAAAALQGGAAAETAQAPPAVEIAGPPVINIPDTPASAPPVARPAAAPAAPAPTVDPGRWAEIQRRAADLERNNEDLHRQVAQAGQQRQVLQDQIDLLQRQLSDTVGQLRESQLARDEADRRAQALLASDRQQGRAFTANNSVKQSLQVVALPGLDVRQEGDVIRITIPADQLFQPSSVQWVSGASTILDQVAEAVARNYPRQQVTIEAHTDSSVIGLPGGSHQLAASQALAVYQHLTARSRLPAKQLVTMAYGPNYPRVSNATDAGRSQNRRVELVIYPEEIQ